MTMFSVLVTDPHTNQTVGLMVYGKSEPNARRLFNDECVHVQRASDLDIAAHVRAQKPIIGEPDPIDPNQNPLPLE